MKKMQKTRLLSLLLGMIVLAADQGTKLWAIDYLAPPGAVSVTGFFNVVFVMNSGVTFGLFPQSSPVGVWLLAGFSVAIIAYLGWLWWRATQQIEGFLLMAVLGGAMGNVVDRLRFGAVIDFLDFHLFGYHWPAFNVADSMIVLGIGGYLWQYIVREK